MKSLLKMFADFFLKGVAENARHHPDVISKAAVFRDEFISRSYKDINYYFGNFIRATETNEEKSWEFTIAEAEKFN